MTGGVDIDAELIAAGLKEGPGSGDVMAVSNGTSALIHVHPERAAALPAIGDFLASRDWVGALYGPEKLGEVGQVPEGGLCFAVSMAARGG